jgi:hypothetical protein
MGTDLSARIIDTPHARIADALSMVRRNTNAYRAIHNAYTADVAYRTGMGWNTDTVSGHVPTSYHVGAGDTFVSTVAHHITIALAVTTDLGTVRALARAYAATMSDAYAYESIHAPNPLAPRT